MSSGSPNCSGLTKIVTPTWSHSAAARTSSDRWPACRAPMVGTNPTVAPRARAASRVAENPATVLTTSTAGSRRLGHAGRHRRHPDLRDVVGGHLVVGHLVVRRAAGQGGDEVGGGAARDSIGEDSGGGEGGGGVDGQLQGQADAGAVPGPLFRRNG